MKKDYLNDVKLYEFLKENIASMPDMVYSPETECVLSSKGIYAITNDGAHQITEDQFTQILNTLRS